MVSTNAIEKLSGEYMCPPIDVSAAGNYLFILHLTHAASLSEETAHVEAKKRIRVRMQTDLCIGGTRFDARQALVIYTYVHGPNRAKRGVKDVGKRHHVG